MQYLLVLLKVKTFLSIMNKKKLHYSLLSFSLILCIIMLSDSTFVPSVKQVETITHFKERSSGRGTYSFHNYSVVTQNGEYDIRIELYSKLFIGDSVSIFRSLVTNAKQRIECNYLNVVYSNNLGFSREIIGTIFLGVMFCIIILLMLFYEKIAYEPAKENGTFFTLISIVPFFYFHIQ